MGVYQGKKWRSIEEHLNDILGRQCRELADEPRASQHFMALLDCCHQRPAATQLHYLQQFTEAVKKVQMKQVGGRAGGRGGAGVWGGVHVGAGHVGIGVCTEATALHSPPSTPADGTLNSAPTHPCRRARLCLRALAFPS